MISMRNVVFCLILMATVSPIIGYNVLMVCPMPVRSHYNLCKGVVDTLVNRGHNVSFISAFESNKPKFIDLSIPELEKIKKSIIIPNFGLSKKSIFELMTMASNMPKAIAETMFSNDQIQNLLSDKSQTFDVVIYEYLLNDIAVVGFGVKYDCPVIALSPANLMQWLAEFTRNPLSVASVPDVFLPFTGKMNLWQRVLNFLYSIITEIIGNFLMHPVQESLYYQYFPEESKRVPFNQLETLVSGVLINSHPSIGIARSLLPNTVEIGGYHIKDPEALPEDLKKILDEANDGVIYFSMGSNLKSKDMSPEITSSLLKSFNNLNQTILWKYENNLPDAPKNLIIQKWMPQTGILAHPNVKLFITHGGLLSRIEAAHFGVPLIAIPIFGDQYHNSKSMAERGNAIYLEFTNITEQSFSWALNEALGNSKYTDIAKEVQRLYHDRPMNPRDLLNYHVEHIARTKGGKHLAPPPLSRFSHMLLDVIGIVFIFIITVTVLFSWVMWKFCARREQLKISDKKNL